MRVRVRVSIRDEGSGGVRGPSGPRVGLGSGWAPPPPRAAPIDSPPSPRCSSTPALPRPPPPPSLRLEVRLGLGLGGRARSGLGLGLRSTSPNPNPTATPSPTPNPNLKPNPHANPNPSLRAAECSQQRRPPPPRRAAPSDAPTATRPCSSCSSTPGRHPPPPPIPLATCGDHHGARCVRHARGWYVCQVRAVRGALGARCPAPPVRTASGRLARLA